MGAILIIIVLVIAGAYLLLNFRAQVDTKHPQEDIAEIEKQYESMVLLIEDLIRIKRSYSFLEMQPISLSSCTVTVDRIYVLVSSYVVQKYKLEKIWTARDSRDLEYRNDMLSFSKGNPFNERDNSCVYLYQVIGSAKTVREANIIINKLDSLCKVKYSRENYAPRS